jgi:hypothetical protein
VFDAIYKYKESFVDVLVIAIQIGSRKFS